MLSSISNINGTPAADLFAGAVTLGVVTLLVLPSLLPSPYWLMTHPCVLQQQEIRCWLGEWSMASHCTHRVVSVGRGAAGLGEGMG